MEKQTDTLGLLDLIPCPGFCARDNRILKVNPACQGLFIEEGEEIAPLLLSGHAQYASFVQGCLYLTLQIQGQPRGASVTRMAGVDIFLLDSDIESKELQALALASRELRRPMGSIMAAMAALDPDTAAFQQLNRGLHQMMRIIGNMSDAGRSCGISHPQTRNVTADLREIFEKARSLLQESHQELVVRCMDEDIYCLADRDLLDRAVFNMISNAAKFSPKNSTITLELTRREHFLQLSVTDQGSGIAENILSNVFNRYLRPVSIEDSRFGLGLGMVMIRSAAAHHGGAVLIDQPQGGSTRVTLTLAIRQNKETVLRSPILQVDYTGGFDHALVELSDCLGSELY